MRLAVWLAPNVLIQSVSSFYNHRKTYAFLLQLQYALVMQKLIRDAPRIHLLFPKKSEVLYHLRVKFNNFQIQLDTLLSKLAAFKISIFQIRMGVFFIKIEPLQQG